MTGLRISTPGIFGVGTGTSLALGGATIGTDALAVTGTMTVSGATSHGNLNLTAATVPANGFYLPGANTLAFSSNTTLRIVLNTTVFASNTSGGFSLGFSAASATVPTLRPSSSDTTTGIGAQASGNMSMLVGGVESMRFAANLNIVCNNAAIATNATDGFLYVATCNGTPSGTPTSFTGRVPLVYDTAAHQFWIYDSGWKQPKTPAAAAIITWQ